MLGFDSAYWLQYNYFLEIGNWDLITDWHTHVFVKAAGML
jgi:hypothetical protein